MLHAAIAADLCRAPRQSGSLARGAFVRFFANREWDRFDQRAPRRCAFTSVAPQQRRNASLWRRNTSPLGATNRFVTGERFAIGPLQQPRISFNAAAKTS
jgi:hypothetical protein